jgi:hypothetical protein
MFNIQRQKKWNELSAPAKGGVAFSSALQMGLLLAALWDIRKRPDTEINGSKKFWLPFLFVNFIGPIGYFWKGVKR